MGGMTAEQEATKELYFIESKGERASWKEVSKAEFANHDGTAYFGTVEDVKSQIAAKEDIPLDLVAGYSGSLWLQCGDKKDLSSAMAYARREGVSIRCGRHNTLPLLRQALPGRKIVCITHGGGEYVIDGQWVIGYDLRFDPEAAQKSLDTKASEIKGPRAQRKRGRSRMRCDDLLTPMYNHIVDPILALDACSAPTGARYHYHYVMVYSPWNRYRYMKGIPVMAAFRDKLRLKSFRTKKWQAWIDTIVDKHMNDPEMVPEFRKFVVREVARRR